MTLSVVLLKFILFLVLLPRSIKVFSTISCSFPVLAMPSSVESSGHFLTTCCYLSQSLRLMLAKTNPMGDHGGVLHLLPDFDKWFCCFHLPRLTSLSLPFATPSAFPNLVQFNWLFLTWNCIKCFTEIQRSDLWNLFSLPGKQSSERKLLG